MAKIGRPEIPLPVSDPNLLRVGALPIVYRARSVNALLYIGSSTRAAQRLKEHRSRSGWWKDVAVVDLEAHEDEVAMRAAEAAAIEDERPLHNRRGSLTPPSSAMTVNEVDRHAKPGRSRHLITLDVAVWAELEGVAQALGVSRCGLLEQCANYLTGRRVDHPRRS